MENLMEVAYKVWGILLVAVGLGLVIFVHELGHFLVAKWCGVFVQRFSIGFGPILWSRRAGDTEYALSAIPFGGYVKMLGENPEEEQTDDPRAYSNQPVPKRMAIISAGVVMNLIFGFLLFLAVFNLGLPYTPAVVGGVEPGSPAWKAGLEFGDRIVKVNGKEIIDFESFQQAVMLSNPRAEDRGRVQVVVERGGRLLPFSLYPVERELAPQVGVKSAADLELAPHKPAQPGSAAANPLAGSLQGGERITAVDGRRLSNHTELADYLARHAEKAVKLTVQRAGAGRGQPGPEAEVTLGPQYFRSLGLHFGLAQITAVRNGSPAARAVDEHGRPTPLRPNDKIKAISSGDRLVFEPYDPLRLPDRIARLAAERPGQPLAIQVIRPGQDPRNLTVFVQPEQRPAWTSPPLLPDNPFTIPALGIAYQVFTEITAPPDPRSPAYRAGLRKGDLITGATIDFADQPVGELEVVIDEDNPGLPYVFWMLQEYPEATVQFKVKRGDRTTFITRPMSPEPDPSWPAPIRGLRLVALKRQLPPQGFIRSAHLGYTTTKGWLVKTYLTLRRLIGRTVSPKLFSGPAMISFVGYRFASESFAKLLKFLAILSVNLAVINFLPIPVLDGGHMVFLVWEGVRGKPASQRTLVAANYCGLMLIITLAILITGYDIWRLLRWFGPG